MAEAEIRTIFDLEEYNHIEHEAVFKQRLPEGGGRFHYWSMSLSEWNSLGRPISFIMVLTAYVEINLDAEQDSSVTS